DAAERRQLRRAIAGPSGAAGPERIAGLAVVGDDGPSPRRFALGPGVDDDEPVIHERRPTHAPLDVVVVGEDVGFPFDFAGGTVEAFEPAGRAEGVDVAVGDGRRRAGAVAAERLAEVGRILVDPTLMARGGAIADDGFVVAPLFDRD